MSSNVRCIQDPAAAAWFLNGSSISGISGVDNDVICKTDEDALDIFARQNSWEVDQEELLVGGVDGWQLLPLVEDDLTEPWLVTQDYNSSFGQSFADSLPTVAPPLASNQHEASIQRELIRGQLNDGRCTDDNLSCEQFTSYSWLDKAMLEELGVLANNSVHVSTEQLFLKDDDDDAQQLYVVPMDHELASFAADSSCVGVPSTVELEDLVEILDGSVVEDQIYHDGQIYRESSCPEPVDSTQEWTVTSHSSANSSWQEQEIVPTSCENSDDSFSEDDSSDDEDFVPSTKPARRTVRKHVKRCTVRREEYARLSLSQRRERKKEQNKNAATKYREKKRYEEFEKETTCEKLEKRNMELKKEVAEKEREVKLLRKLVINIFKPADSKKSKTTKK